MLDNNTLFKLNLVGDRAYDSAKYSAELGATAKAAIRSRMMPFGKCLIDKTWKGFEDRKFVVAAS